MSDEKAVVVYSGGMDSLTVLHFAMQNHKEVFPISFNYGQRHKKELDCAAKVCADQGLTHKVVDITSIQELLGGSALTDDIDVPEGHYADENMKKTVVPNRNMILISLAVGYAESLGAKVVYLGAHSGDHAIYPDCRPEFIEAVKYAAEKGTYGGVSVYAPFISTDKEGILRVGHELGVNYADSWTCYKGLEKACGKCGSCVERLEAFANIGIEDPVEYEEK